MGSKACTTCGVVKPLTEYWKQKALKDGLKKVCIPCSKIVNKKTHKRLYATPAYKKKSQAKNRKWMAENKGSFNIYLKEYTQRPYVKEANRVKRSIRRADMDAPLTKTDKQYIKALFKFAVKMSRDTGIPHEVDHIRPVVKGGKTVPTNLQVLTRFDNRSKGSKYATN